MKRILLLGATGSIGLQTVDVIEQHPDQFCLVGIAAGHQVDVMQKINIDKAKLADFLFFNLGWDKHFKDETYFNDFPYNSRKL